MEYGERRIPPTVIARCEKLTDETAVTLKDAATYALAFLTHRNHASMIRNQLRQALASHEEE